MFLLGPEELRSAELTLKVLFPESIRVYGCLFYLNRGQGYNWEVFVDSWPDFQAIICKPKLQGAQDRESIMWHMYSRDRDSLLSLLSHHLDWSQTTLLAGVDQKYLDAVKELAARNNATTQTDQVMVVMTLEDVSHLKFPESNSATRLQPLTTAHAKLVDSRWRLANTQRTYNSVVGYLSSYPSLSVRGGDGTPVAWLLVYHHGAMGRLYTEPDHRRQGYARLLLATMARALHAEGRPVYGFVNENNAALLSLFTSLGFSHKPDYRAVWLYINPT